jgi:hypothetical protein
MLWKKVLNLQCVPTGLNVAKESLPGIFPNPGVGLYSIKNSQDVRYVRIYDLHGKLIQNLQNADTFELNANPGVYLVKLDLKSGNTLHQRIMKL